MRCVASARRLLLISVATSARSASVAPALPVFTGEVACVSTRCFLFVVVLQRVAMSLVVDPAVLNVLMVKVPENEYRRLSLAPARFIVLCILKTLCSFSACSASASAFVQSVQCMATIVDMTS